jgi:hypothetical protein
LTDGIADQNPFKEIMKLKHQHKMKFHNYHLTKSPEKLAVQQLIKKANEIHVLVRNGEISTQPETNFFVAKDSSGENFDMHLQSDEIRNQLGNPTTIGFETVPANSSQIPSTKTGYMLRIRTLDDQSTKNNFDKSVESKIARRDTVSVIYYFNNNGDCTKFPIFPDRIINLIRKKGFVKNENDDESRFKMTPEDFELAGTTLSEILKRGKPQTPQTPEP